MANRSNVVLVVGPFPADGVVRRTSWTAEEHLHIKRVQTWIGTAGCTPGQPFPSVDTFTTVFGANKVLSFVGLDHYTNFTGLHQWVEDMGEDWVDMQAGDEIVVEHASTALAGLPSSSHTQVIIWYVKP